MHSFAGILDTRPRGSRHGIKSTCPICQKKHFIWVLFREVVLADVPGDPGMVRYDRTGIVYKTGTECAKKVTVPVWETFRVTAALEDVQAAAVHPGAPNYDKLFKEFR
jgi:hypothetical protein